MRTHVCMCVCASLVYFDGLIVNCASMMDFTFIVDVFTTLKVVGSMSGRVCYA